MYFVLYSFYLIVYQKIVVNSFITLKVTFNISLRNYELSLRGGTPYEKGVEVDASVGFKSKLCFRFTLQIFNEAIT